MFNLLKSDIYRLVHGKMLWVAAIVLVALSVLAAGMMHWVSSPEFLRMTATSFEMTVNVGDGANGAADVLGEGDAAAANASAEAAAAAGASGRGLSLDELDTLGAAEAAGSAESEEDSVRDDETASDSAFASSELWDLVADQSRGAQRRRFRRSVPRYAHPGLAGPICWEIWRCREGRWPWSSRW